MTYLQLINKVLNKLRLDEVSIIADNYTKLIGFFVNEAKREVEDAWDWNCLRTSITINTVPGIFSYDLDKANGRARILYDRFQRASAWNVTNKTRLRGPAPSTFMTEKLINDPAEGPPMYFDINGVSSDGDPLLNVWPVPDKVYQLQLDLVVPQHDLVNASDTLRVPYWPVILGAYARAISERGEDGGVGYNEADAHYVQALSDAIQLDNSNMPYELVAEVI